MAIHVMLGNSEPLDNGRRLDHASVTYLAVPDSWDGADTIVATSDEVVTAVTTPLDGASMGVWVAHSQASKPDWVWSDDEETEQKIADFYGCPRGIPDDVEDRYYTTTPPGENP